MRVDVLLNTDPEAPARGFRPTDRLAHAARFELESTADHEALLHTAWLTSEACEPAATAGRPDRQALDYREAGHRPLRTGDVVAIDTRVWARSRVGWTLLTRCAPAAPPADAPPADARLADAPPTPDAAPAAAPPAEAPAAAPAPAAKPGRTPRPRRARRRRTGSRTGTPAA